MSSFFTSRYNVRQLFSLIILIALLFYALGLGVWGFTRWSNPKVAEVSSPTPEMSITVTLSPSSKKITPVPETKTINTSLDSTVPLTSTETVPSPTATGVFPTAGAGPTKSPTQTPTTTPFVPPTHTKTPFVPPTHTKTPFVPPTHTKTPFVPPTHTSVPVTPSSTDVPSPTNTSVVGVTPEPASPTAPPTSVAVPPTAEPVPTEATVVGIPSTSSNSNDSGNQIAIPTP